MSADVQKLVKVSRLYLSDFFFHPLQSCQKPQAWAVILWARLHTSQWLLPFWKPIFSVKHAFILFRNRAQESSPARAQSACRWFCFESSIILIQDLIRTPFLGVGGFFPIQMETVVFIMCSEVLFPCAINWPEERKSFDLWNCYNITEGSFSIWTQQ